MLIPYIKALARWIVREGIAKKAVEQTYGAFVWGGIRRFFPSDLK